MSTGKKIQIIEGDLNNAEHAESFLRLTAAYMADPMGESEAWTEDQRSTVVREMKDHPCALILFAKEEGKFVGICTCFYAYSTFLAKPLLNIHDIYVEESSRGKGVGKKLVEAVTNIKQGDPMDPQKLSLLMAWSSISVGLKNFSGLA